MKKFFGRIFVSEKDLFLQTKEGKTLRIVNLIRSYPSQKGNFRNGDIVQIVGQVDSLQLIADNEKSKILFRPKNFQKVYNQDRNWKKFLLDPNSKQKIIDRAKIKNLTHKYFNTNGFIEVEVPSMIFAPAEEWSLNYFETKINYQNGKKKKMFLSTSPELQHKKLLVAGFDKIYSLTKSFRNVEPEDSVHSFEFTILEFYETFIDYNDEIERVLNWLRFLAKSFYGKEVIKFKAKEFDLSKVEVFEFKKKYEEKFSVNLQEVAKDLEHFRKFAQSIKVKVDKQDSISDVFYKIFIKHFEQEIVENKNIIVIKDYPFFEASLARRKKENPFYAERFEIFIGGLEIANGFSELNDPKEQKERFIEEKNIRKNLKKQNTPLDHDFFDALEVGMPPASGVAVGFDRVVQLILGEENIKNILTFPLTDLFS